MRKTYSGMMLVPFAYLLLATCAGTLAKAAPTDTFCDFPKRAPPKAACPKYNRGGLHCPTVA